MPERRNSVVSNALMVPIIIKPVEVSNKNRLFVRNFWNNCNDNLRKRITIITSIV